MEFLIIKVLVINILVNGKEIFQMVKEYNNGSQEQDIKDRLSMVENKGLENTLIHKDLFMKGDLMIIILMEKEFSNGEMEDFMKVIGNMEECMDMEYIYGQMVTDIKDIILTGRKMV
jgi:hypothetical protein